MADADTYQAPDSSNLDAAKASTAQAAATQKQQQTSAETPHSAKPAAPAAKSATPAAGGAAGAVKKAVMNTPVAQGVSKILGSFKKGGEVPETGNYKLHEGEEVVPNNGRASEYRKVFKARGDAGKHSWGGK